MSSITRTRLDVPSLQVLGVLPHPIMTLDATGLIVDANAACEAFFQIGETKYGRPILIRGYDKEMSFEDAIKLMMVSFDSTLKANLSVGLPLDLMVLERDKFEPLHERRIEHDDPYFDAISSSWSNALRQAFHSLPDYSFYQQAE